MAWRCQTEDSITDPCFENKNGQIVCDIDPENPESGFELKLTETLPEELRNTGSDENFPWYIKLQDGITCRPYTGTALHINNEYAYYYCSEKNMHLLNGVEGRTTFDKTGEYWKVKTVIYPGNEGYGEEVPVEKMNVIKVWK